MKKYITTGLLLFVFLFYGCGVNHPPVIQSIGVTPFPVEAKATVTITVQATDEDNDPLTYQWILTETRDTFSTTGPSLSWTAPETPGVYHFSITVDDGRGGIADTTYALEVVEPQLAVKLYSPYNIKTRSIDLAWTPVLQSNFLRYEVLQADQPDVQIHGDVIEESIKYNRDDTTFTVEGLTPGHTYYFAVVVVDSSMDRFYSNEVSATTNSYDIKGSVNVVPGHCLRLARRLYYTYVAAREAGVLAITTNQEHSPSIITSYKPDGFHWAYDVHAYPDYLYAAFHTGGLHILDVSTGSQITLVALIDTTDFGQGGIGGYPVSVFSTGSRIYVGWEKGPNLYGMTIVDVTDPTAPVPLDTIYLPDTPNDIFVSGNYAYIACDDAGMVTVNVFNDQPTIANIYPTDYPSITVYVSGNYAYLAASESGLLRFDISSPATPTLWDSWKAEEGNNAQGIYVAGEWAYLADGVYGLRVINISETPMKLFNTVNPSLEITDVWANTISQKETIAHIADWNGTFMVVGW